MKIIGNISILMIIIGAIIWGWFVLHGEYGAPQQLIGIAMLCIGGCGFDLSFIIKSHTEN